MMIKHCEANKNLLCFPVTSPALLIENLAANLFL